MPADGHGHALPAVSTARALMVAHALPVSGADAARALPAVATACALIVAGGGGHAAPPDGGHGHTGAPDALPADGYGHALPVAGTLPA